MKEYTELAKTIKNSYIPKKDKGISIWEEKDVINGNIEDALVVILKTKGCNWAHTSGCLMCGYFKDSIVSNEIDIDGQINEAMKRYNGQKIVKFFTSGSFLDEREIPLKIQEKILKKFSEAEKIIIESRPEFIKNLDCLPDDMRIEVAMGLESAQDKVLKYSINKGFTFDAWHHAAKQVKNKGLKLKVYLLLKPPFLTENDAIKDVLLSVKKISNIADTISLNPVAVHSKTIIDWLWKHNIYNPPWLWSVVEVLRESKKIYDGLLKCDIVGGGKIRGSHNCGCCDNDVLHAIRDFNLSQDITILTNPLCKCREEWLDFRETEEFLRG